MVGAAVCGVVGIAAAAAVEDRIDAAVVEPTVAAAGVDNGTAAAAAVAVALAAGADNRHQARLVVARQRASNLCPPGSAHVPHPPGPAEQPTWPSFVAWSSTDRQSQFLI